MQKEIRVHTLSGHLSRRKKSFRRFCRPGEAGEVKRRWLAITQRPISWAIVELMHRGPFSKLEKSKLSLLLFYIFPYFVASHCWGDLSHCDALRSCHGNWYEGNEKEFEMQSLDAAFDVQTWYTIWIRLRYAFLCLRFCRSPDRHQLPVILLAASQP